MPSASAELPVPRFLYFCSKFMSESARNSSSAAMNPVCAGLCRLGGSLMGGSCLRLPAVLHRRPLRGNRTPRTAEPASKAAPGGSPLVAVPLGVFSQFAAKLLAQHSTLVPTKHFPPLPLSAVLSFYLLLQRWLAPEVMKVSAQHMPPSRSFLLA